MSKSRNLDTSTSPSRIPALVILAWLIPGAGHFLIGERARGVVIFVVITATFWTGLIIGGAYSTVNLTDNFAWFFAQVFAGTHTILAMIIRRLPDAMPSYSKTLDLATIYTGVAGLLNVVVILDVLTRLGRGRDSCREAK